MRKSARQQHYHSYAMWFVLPRAMALMSSEAVCRYGHCRCGISGPEFQARRSSTEANELVADIHDRMPFILAPGNYARWLSEEPTRARRSETAPHRHGLDRRTWNLPRPDRRCRTHNAHTGKTASDDIRAIARGSTNHIE